MNAILVFKYLVLTAVAAILLPRGGTLAVVYVIAAVLLELAGDYFFHPHGYDGTSLSKKAYGWCILVGTFAAVWFWFSYQNHQDTTWLTQLGWALMFFHVVMVGLTSALRITRACKEALLLAQK